jgi:hypothetical protein
MKRHISRFVLYVSIAFISIPSFCQEGYISPKHKAKIEKRSYRETKTYNKSEYKVYGTQQSLEEAINEYYRYHFSEVSDGVRMYATPTAMSRESDLEKAVEKGWKKAKESALGIMQLYFYSWINVDERTSQEQKDALIKAAEKAEPSIKKLIHEMEPVKSYILYKELKRDYRVETRTVYDQELLKKKIRALIIEHLEKKELFEGKDLDALLTFEK